jgi:O-acetyl-ADP-ribose deacetylase (regulator of RNase III)
MQTLIGKTRLELIEGDIADQDTDAVVTAAHWDLGGGQGTDGSIHFKAGPELLKECRTIGGCPIGDAVITHGYNLKARYVIHTVGPIYEEGSDYEAELLACAYQSSLRVATENGLQTISFPSISTGAFSYPMYLAAPIALQAIYDHLTRETHNLTLIRMVLYTSETPEAYTIYTRAWEKLGKSVTVCHES